MSGDYAVLIADLPRLLRIARGLGLQHHDAEDLVQAAVVRALPHWHAVETNPHPYLRTVMTNLFIDRVRRGRIVSEYPVGLFADDQQPVARDSSEHTALRVDVQRALSTLSPLARSVLVLRFLDGQTIAATAQILQRPEGTIARISSEGIAKLRDAHLLTSMPEGRTRD